MGHINIIYSRKKRYIYSIPSNQVSRGALTSKFQITQLSQSPASDTFIHARTHKIKKYEFFSLHSSFSGQLTNATLRAVMMKFVVVVGNNIASVTLELDVVVGELAELAVVDAELLLCGADAQAQAGNQVHKEEDDAG
jgi:hypothetical protein